MSTRFKVLCVAAARPNFMKIKPVLDALEARGVATVLIHTGQHFDPQMSEIFFSDIGLRAPDRNLAISSGTSIGQISRVMEAFEPVMLEEVPDAVVVVGDVNATVACAITAAHRGCVVVHVEAGLRSRDWSMPEEINRVLTDSVSDLLAVPSSDAADNLRSEGVHEDRIALVGNVMIDTLFANLKRAAQLDTIERLGLVSGNYGVVTLHRPSNVDNAAEFDRLFAILVDVAKEVPLVFPVHPRTKAHLERLTIPPSITIAEPLGYLDFLCLQRGARLVLTDSGGIQEETTALGVPCLTLRSNTERPITITEGTNRLVGTDHEDVVRAAREVLSFGVAPKCPALWDGHAGDRIAEAILSRLKNPNGMRPTSLSIQ